MSNLINPHACIAYDAGKADALAGKQPGGQEYTGVCQDAYLLGFLAGCATKPVSDREVMDAMLEMLRSGQVEPVVRLTEAQLDEIEQERVGEEISRRPWEW